MAAMHLCDVGTGVTSLGYYMYHGGTNPHSLVHTGDRDAPNTTLQESSFEPAGAHNPMPSISYDFFAPLGEFGQPRRHFHQMRQLHLLINRWGRWLAGTVPSPSPPDRMPTSDADNRTLRWYVRSNGSLAFLFVNNYQRLATLAQHKDVRFLMRWHSTHGSGDGTTPASLSASVALASNHSDDSIAVPSNHSKPLTIEPGVWFVWVVGLPLLSSELPVGGTAHSLPHVAWATAQPLTQVSHPGKQAATSRHRTHHHAAQRRAHGHASRGPGAAPRVRETLFLVQTVGIEAEVAIALGGAHLTQHRGVATPEGREIVLREVAPSHAPLATVEVDEPSAVVEMVLLPTNASERVWTVEVRGATHLVYAPEAALVLADTLPTRETGEGVVLHVRSDTTAGAVLHVLICPPPGSLRQGGALVPQATDGVFGSYTIHVALPPMPTVTWTLTRAAGPPRQIPIVARTGKPQEPTAGDWAQAAVYHLVLSIPEEATAAELRLAIDYTADAARVYLGDTLLTDNWYSGYRADGAMELGLSYLAGEHPSLLVNGTVLELRLLPLQRASLEKNVFLARWPDFAGATSVCRLNGVRVLGLVSTDLVVGGA